MNETRRIVKLQLDPAQHVQPSTKDALLEAASRLMREGDTLEISLSEIARIAKVNSALIGYHFGNKRGLLIALIERDALYSLNQFRELLTGTLSATQKLRYHLAGIINTYERYPYLNRLLGIIIRDSDSVEAAAITKRFIRPIVDAYDMLIKQGIESGEFRPITTMNLYFICIGMCEEIFSSRSVLRNCFGVDEITKKLKRSFIADATSIVLLGMSDR